MAARLKFGFIPFPLAIVDESADLSLGEYRLLGYLLRHRFRVKSEIFRMTQDALLKGVTAPDGSRRDKGCGMTSGRDIKTAREKLVERGWLQVTDAPDGMLYELTLSDEDEDLSEAGVNPIASADAREQRERGSEATLEKSAECTEGESAKKQDSQCIVSPEPVQNALDVIRREKVKKVGEGLTAGGLIPEPLDPRYRQFRDDYELYWQVLNGSLPMPFTWKDDRALKDFLHENPRIERADWTRCLQNRAQSEVPRAQPLHRWLGDLLKFAECAFDGYGKKIFSSKGRKQDEQEQLVDGNRNTLKAWVERGAETAVPGAVPGRGRDLLGPGDHDPTG